VHVHVLRRRAQHAVLVEVGFAHAQNVSGRFERREIRALIRRIGDNEQDVDDRLRREPGYGGRADVLDPQLAAVQRGTDLGRFVCEPRSPGRVVLEQADLGGLHAADQDPRQVLLELVF
jgi:hypothetical protein